MSDFSDFKERLFPIQGVYMPHVKVLSLTGEWVFCTITVIFHT